MVSTTSNSNRTKGTANSRAFLGSINRIEVIQPLDKMKGTPSQENNRSLDTTHQRREMSSETLERIKVIED